MSFKSIHSVTAYEKLRYNTYSPTTWVIHEGYNRHDDVSFHPDKRNQGELLGRDVMEKPS